MIQLIRYEFVKIMMRKSIALTFAIFLMFLVAYSFVQHAGLSDASEDYRPYEGPITQEKANLARDHMQIIGLNNEYIYPNGVFYDILNFSPETKNNYTSYDENGQIRTRTVDVTDIHYNKPWGYLLEYIDQFGTVFMIIFILLGLAPVFANEYALGTASLLRSSKRGKSKLVTAKLLASMIYIVVCVIVFAGVNLQVYWLRFGHLAGADTPIQSVAMYFDTFYYEFSPYRFTALQYYIVQLLTHAAGSLVFGCIVLLVSVLSSTPFIAVSVSAAIVGLPYLAYDVLNLNSGWMSWLESFQLSTMIRVTRLFKYDVHYSVLGLNLSYFTLYMAVISLFTIGVVVFTYRAFRQREVFS